jgi:hypothetical protein
MKRKTWIALILAAMAILAGGYLLWNVKILVLQLENTDRGRIVRFPIKPSERFSIYYIHSVYQEPVIEDFEADPDTIILKGVRTTSRAIGEQYGFETPKSFQPMNEKLGAIYIRVAPGEGQGLILRDKKIYLSEIGQRGDRVQLSVRSVCLGPYFFSRLAEIT